MNCEVGVTVRATQCGEIDEIEMSPHQTGKRFIRVILDEAMKQFGVLVHGPTE